MHLGYHTIAAEFMNILLLERKGKLACLNKLLFCKVLDLVFFFPFPRFLFLNPTLNSCFESFFLFKCFHIYRLCFYDLIKLSYQEEIIASERAGEAL